MAPWSRRQQIALAVTPKISSVFSLAGSSWIILEVLTSRQKRNHPYHRLLLAMSAYDAAESVWNFASTWPLPRDGSSEQVVWAAGTTQTCSAQGFFLTLSVAVPLYNAGLAVYYLLVVNHNVRDRTLRRIVEPALHATAAVWAWGTAIAAVSLGLINNAVLWCWIAPLPLDCLDSWRYGDEGNCERGDNAWIYQWGFYFAPLWLCIFVATVATYLVYLRVNQLDRRTLRFRRPTTLQVDRQGRRSSRFSFNGDDDDDDSDAPSSFDDDRNATMSSVRGSKLFDQSDNNNRPRELILIKSSLQRSNSKRSSFTSNGDRSQNDSQRIVSPTQSLRSLASAGDDNEVVFDLAAQEKSDDDFLSGVLDDQASQESATAVHLNVIARWRSRRSIYREDYPRSVEVMRQAVWYLGVFYITHVWSTSNRIVQLVNQGSTYFGLTLVHSWFDPFQGFLNYLVYQRPRYIKIRKAHPKLSRLGACWKALQFSYLPPPARPTNLHQPRRSLFGSSPNRRTSDSHLPAAGESFAERRSMPSIVERSDENMLPEDGSIYKSVRFLRETTRKSSAECTGPLEDDEDTSSVEVDAVVRRNEDATGQEDEQNARIPKEESRRDGGANETNDQDTLGQGEREHV